MESWAPGEHSQGWADGKNTEDDGSSGAPSLISVKSEMEVGGRSASRMYSCPQRSRGQALDTRGLGFHAASRAMPSGGARDL